MKPKNRVFPMGSRESVLIGLAIVLAAFVPRLGFSGNFYQGVSPSNLYVPGGVVAYQFDTNITATEQETYLDSLREWELAANIHFIPRTTQTNWILFQYAPGTFIDHVDFFSVPEVVTVSVLSRSQVCHEMGHALGFTHENIRIDQATYLTVLTNNIYPASNIYWFTIDPTSVTNGPYDFESVMHLANNFSSISPTNLYTQLANPGYEEFQPRMGNWALSKGDRAAAAYLYGPPAVPLTNVVTTTADVGAGSLRAALYYGVDHPGTTIRFNMQTNDLGFSNGVFTIHLTGYLPPLVTDGTVIDGSTQPGFAGKPLIIVDGSQMIPEAYDPGTVTGLLIYAANCQVKNLSFQNFNWNGLTLEYAYATNNTIAGCWFGLDYTGTNVAPNAYQGILICAGASRNIIGGTNALARNVLSGNSEDGIFITDSNTTGNVVLGNYIGTDASGERALNNAFGGVVIQGGANSNIIGSPIPSGHNVLSGNVNYGLWVGSDNNTVQGNWIGLDAGGAVALPNTFAGIYVIDGAQSNLITGNVLSGNYSEGIRLAGAGTSANRVQGNFIGTDVTGTNAIPNGFAGLTFFAGAAGNTAGGLTTATRNIISGNGGYGVVIGDTNTTGNGVEGNFIGVGADGIHAVGNGIGVLISNGAQTNTLGGVTTGARNIISGNLYSGILITDPGTSWNSVQGNYAGTAPGGSTALGNGYEALDIVAGAQNNTVGGTATGAGNVLSGNGTRGVWISDTNTTGNLVQGNDIGLAADGATALGNAWEGVIVINGAQSNVIGLKTDGSGAGNRISANGYEGVAVYDDSTVGNVIRGNNVYSNGYLGINLVGGTENSYGVTANHPGGAVPGPNDLQNYPIITNAFVSGSSTVISGTLNSTAGRTFLIDVYRNTLPDPSGYGEGQVYLGSVAAATGGSGNAQFSFNAGSNFAGQYFSATATDQTSGDTSEFGFDVVATNLPAPPSFTGPATLTSTGFAANILLTTGQSYHVQSSTNLGANPIPWVNLTNFVAGATNFMFLDRSATNYRSRFYRVVSP